MACTFPIHVSYAGQDKKNLKLHSEDTYLTSKLILEPEGQISEKIAAFCFILFKR